MSVNATLLPLNLSARLGISPGLVQADQRLVKRYSDLGKMKYLLRREIETLGLYRYNVALYFTPLTLPRKPDNGEVTKDRYEITVKIKNPNVEIDSQGRGEAAVFKVIFSPVSSGNPFTQVVSGIERSDSSTQQSDLKIENYPEEFLTTSILLDKFRDFIRTYEREIKEWDLAAANNDLHGPYTNRTLLHRILNRDDGHVSIVTPGEADRFIKVNKYGRIYLEQRNGSL